MQSRWGGGKGRSCEAEGFVWAGQWQKAAFQVRHRLLWGNVLWDSSSVELGFVSSPTQPFQIVPFLAEFGVPWFLCRSEGPSCAISVPPAPARSSVPPAPARSCCCPSPAPASPALLSAPALIPNSCPCYSWAGLWNRLVPTGAR